MKHQRLANVVILFICLLLVACSDESTPTSIPVGAKASSLKQIYQSGYLSATGASINSLAFSQDGKSIAVGQGDGFIKLFSVPSGKELMKIQAHKNNVKALAFAPDDKTLISGGDDGLIKFWSVDSGKETSEIKTPRQNIKSLVFSADGKTLASIESDRYELLQFWSVSNKQLLKEFEGATDLRIKAITFSPDSKTIALGTADNSPVGTSLYLWPIADMMKSDPLENIPNIASGLGEEEEGVSAVAYSIDGKLLLSAYESGIKRVENTRNTDQVLGYKIWSIGDKKEIGEVNNFTQPITWLAFSPDSQTIFTVNESGTLQLWDMQNDREFYNITDKNLEAMSLSKNGKYLATGYSSGSFKLWEVVYKSETR